MLFYRIQTLFTFHDTCLFRTLMTPLIKLDLYDMMNQRVMQHARAKEPLQETEEKEHARGKSLFLRALS